jgi:hypothetical protein
MGRITIQCKLRKTYLRIFDHLKKGQWQIEMVVNRSKRLLLHLYQEVFVSLSGRQSNVAGENLNAVSLCRRLIAIWYIRYS